MHREELRASQDASAPPLLRVEGLCIDHERRGQAAAPIARDVSMRVDPGEIVGLIGESGSGKSVTAKSLIGMLPRGIRVTGGTAEFRGRDLLRLGPRDMRAIRGAEISLIPQDALHALNPVHIVGRQVGEPIEVHTRQPRSAIRQQVEQLLRQVRIPDPSVRSTDYPHQFSGGMQQRVLTAIRQQVEQLLRQVRIPDPSVRSTDYPHQFSGGMQQRVLTAMALSMEPPLILADEPTALDVTIQAQILELIRDLRNDTGTSFLFISHDLGLVSTLCDRIYVMYAGEIVESSRRDEIFRAPRHPYTQGLIGSVPRLRGSARRLATIPGRIPRPSEEIAGCRFRPRCPLAEARCTLPPELRHDSAGHAARCWLA